MNDITKTTTSTFTPPVQPVVQPKAEPKKVRTWKLKAAIALLSIILLATFAGAGYFGYKAYEEIKDKDDQIAALNSEVDKLKQTQSANSIELQKKVENLETTNKGLVQENLKLTEDLRAANTKIEQLSPKDIKTVDYKSLLPIDDGAETGKWLDPIYTDLTADGKNDAVYAFLQDGTGRYLNVYVYTYIDNQLTQILKAEGYQKGTAAVLSDATLEIKSESGTPDSPVTASSKFKWNSSTKKMVKI